MANIDLPSDGKGSTKMSLGGCSSSFEELIGNTRQCAYDHHRLRSDSTLHDFDQPPNCRRILDRRASELHHHDIFALIKSAVSLATHGSSLRTENSRAIKDHRQIAAGGGFG